MSYVVDLETFHGPLDLLLYLVGKNEIDIYDIPIAVITDQYMEYLQYTGDFNLEKLGDFLLMASYLLSIKSRMLLPRSPFDSAEGNEEADSIDPREELVKMLLDYKKYKKVAEYLLAKQSGDYNRTYYRNSDYSYKPEQIIIADIKSLSSAYNKLLHKLPAKGNDYHVPREDVSVADKMEQIIHVLQKRKGWVIFQELFIGVQTRKEALAFFLALLELIRLQKVAAVQNDIFSDITIWLQVGDE